jgi:hypothetical protein
MLCWGRHLGGLGLCRRLPKEIEELSLFLCHISGAERIGAPEGSRPAEEMAVERTDEITVVSKIASGEVKPTEKCRPPLPVNNGVSLKLLADAMHCHNPCHITTRDRILSRPFAAFLISRPPANSSGLTGRKEGFIPALFLRVQKAPSATPCRIRIYGLDSDPVRAEFVRARR